MTTHLFNKTLSILECLPLGTGSQGWSYFVNDRTGEDSLVTEDQEGLNKEIVRMRIGLPKSFFSLNMIKFY